ncbi:MAG: amidophosphoribosyltransferase [Acetomicrobium sp.]
MCGIFGVIGPKEPSILEDVYLGLYALQHRGQESAGVAWFDEGGALRLQKGMGLVHAALSQEQLSKERGSCAIGHVRYSTAGESSIINAQPLHATYSKGQVAIAHNGNITNAEMLKRDLESRGAIFQSTTDTEVILHLMAHEQDLPPIDALIKALSKLRGAFSIVALIEGRLVAARDPWGFRPLVIGKRDGVHYVASESCALDIVKATHIRDVNPGEIVIIERGEITSLSIPVKPARRFRCSFEYVYLARPDSEIDGRSVYDVRLKLGQNLAGTCPSPDGEMVLGMPDSGTIGALGYAVASDLPFEMAIVRNRYVGRTFIQPTQRVRQLGVQIKLNPIDKLIRGRNIVVVDDSIVRGTTSQLAVRFLREAGARKIHLRIASPPVRFPCLYGIDTPRSADLAAAAMDTGDLRDFIGADTLCFLKVEDLINSIDLPAEELCTACFDGKYLEE